MKATVKLMAMATVMVALASCSSDSVYNPNAVIEQKEAQFEKQFVKEFGKIDPNHTWGFGTAGSVTAMAQTRTTVTGNGLSTYITSSDVPALITPEESAKVLKAFQDKTGEVVSNLDLTNFFIQHVAAGHNKYTYTDNNGHEQTISDASSHMDYMCANGEHIDSFNATSGRKENAEFIEGKREDGQDNRVTKETDCVLMVNSKTTFTWHNSDDSSEHNDYIVMKIDGAYYVGFDYSSNKGVKCDGIYDDWIVKITEANVKSESTGTETEEPTTPTPQSIPYNKRIMCEDLGTIGDFDYNDVVFDIYTDYSCLYGASQLTYIRIMAAGGILPLYVAGKEVHELFGVSTSTMVNTGKGPEKEPVTFSIPATWEGNITVSVTYEGSEYELKAEQGRAPKRICISSLIDWPAETEPISKTYPDFSGWVEDQYNFFWNN